MSVVIRLYVLILFWFTLSDDIREISGPRPTICVCFITIISRKSAALSGPYRVMAREEQGSSRVERRGHVQLQTTCSFPRLSRSPRFQGGIYICHLHDSKGRS